MDGVMAPDLARSIRWVGWTMGLLVLALAAHAGVAPAQPRGRSVTLQEVTVDSSDGTTVRIRTSGAPRYQTMLLDTPTRLVIDLGDAVYAWRKAPLTLGGDPIRQIRASQYSKTVARVVIELSRKVPYRILASRVGLSIVLEPVTAKAEPGRRGSSAGVTPSEATPAASAARGAERPEELSAASAIAAPPAGGEGSAPPRPAEARAAPPEENAVTAREPGPDAGEEGATAEKVEKIETVVKPEAVDTPRPVEPAVPPVASSSPAPGKGSVAAVRPGAGVQAAPFELDPRALATRGLDREIDGDHAGAIADLRAALETEPDPARRAGIETLLQLLTEPSQ